MARTLAATRSLFVGDRLGGGRLDERIETVELCRQLKDLGVDLIDVDFNGGLDVKAGTACCKLADKTHR